MRANSFVLSLCSPVLHRMLCGGFIESKKKEIVLTDVDGKTFGKVMDIWCGKFNNVEMVLDEVKELAIVADRLQITEVSSALDETVARNLSVAVCSDVLNWSSELGLRKSEHAARKLATERFEELAKSEGFKRMNEEALGRLLDRDDLAGRNEEAVWEAVTAWRKAEEGQARGCGLVEKIRFPLMKEEYLQRRVVDMVPAEDAEWMEGVVAEALRAKDARLREDGGDFEFDLLGPKALDPRVGLKVLWGDYADGGGRRLSGHTSYVWAVVECEGRVCSGSGDGSIRVWSMTAEATEERTLVPAGAKDDVCSLSVWAGRLISGHNGGRLMVWNVVTGTCDQVLRGHKDSVWAMAVCGSRLASGSDDRFVKVWAMGASGQRTCEMTLRGHTDCVRSLVGWQDKLLSGSDDTVILVWEVETGAHVAMLTGHAGGVLALLVHGDRLFSASRDGTIRVWALGTWAALLTVEAYGRGTGRYPWCLAVSGSQLVCGSFISHPPGLPGEVRVWGLEGLELQHTLPAGADVLALLAVEGEVWAGVGRDVVVWGRGA